MKIVSYKCGCVKIADTYVFLRYCEGDSQEYGFYLNNTRQCDGDPTVLDENTAHGFLWQVWSLAQDGEKYRRLRDQMRLLLNE